MAIKELTRKEEEIMNFFWAHGPLYVKDILEFYDDPKPHFNTVSTIVRGLEEKGFVAHEAHGKTYRYYASVSQFDMGRRTLKSIVERFFKNSYLGVVSSLVKDEDITADELRCLIDEVERNEEKK